MNEFDNIKPLVYDAMDKYRQLVWYARKSPEDRVTNPVIDNECLKLETTYPDECNDIRDPDDGDWTHGFNSGMLAALRYTYGYLTNDPEEIDIAENSFPELDS